MKTEMLIRMIQTEASDWTPVSIMMYLSVAQDMMLNHEIASMIAIDPTTGAHPSFTTTSGKLRYTVNTVNGFPSDAWKVWSLYNDDPLNPVEGVSFEDDTGDGAVIQFASDPGVVTYSVLYYRKPTEITTPRTPLTVPAKYHLLLKRITMVLLEQAEHGAPSQDMEIIRRTDLPKFWQDMNTSITTSTTVEAYV